MSDLDSLDALVDHVKHGVEQVGKAFTDPAEDWQQMLFIQDPEGQMIIVALVLDTPEESAAAVAMAIVEQDAERIALVQSVWTWEGAGRERPTDEHGQVIQVKDLPDRGEAVSVTAADRSGRMEMAQARITRHENAPPTLAEWDMKMGMKMVGRFPDAIRAGFAAQRARES